MSDTHTDPVDPVQDAYTDDQIETPPTLDELLELDHGMLAQKCLDALRAVQSLEALAESENNRGDELQSEVESVKADLDLKDRILRLNKVEIERTQDLLAEYERVISSYGLQFSEVQDSHVPKSMVIGTLKALLTTMEKINETI